jgi:hypothetical protein
MKKAKSKISGNKMSVDSLARMIVKSVAMKEDLRNFATKQDLKNELKNYSTKDDLKRTEENIRADIKEEFKKYATRQEMHAMEQRLVDAMSVNTNKILSAFVSSKSKQDERILLLEEKVF